MLTLHDNCSYIEHVQFLFCALLIYIFSNSGLLNLNIIPPEMLMGCLVCLICNLSSFHKVLYIQTFYYDCSHIEHIHPIFCAHLIIYF